MKPRRGQLAASTRKRLNQRDILSVNQRLGGIAVGEDDDSDYVPEEPNRLMNIGSHQKSDGAGRTKASRAKLGKTEMTDEATNVANEANDSEIAEGME